MRISDWSSDVCSSDLVESLAQDRRGDGAAGRVQRTIDEPRLSIGVAAEADDARQSLRLGPADEMVVLRVVAVEDRDAGARHAFEDFRLGVGDLIACAEELQMRRPDDGDDGDPWPDLTGHGATFAGMTDAEPGGARRMVAGQSG